MDTRFEFNIKKVGIKGDDKALYLFIDGKLTAKLAYKDIEYVVNRCIKRADRQQLSSSQDESSLPVATIAVENDE